MHVAKLRRAPACVSLVFLWSVAVATAAPMVKSIATPPPGEYGVGSTTSIGLLFDEAVLVTGVPSVEVHIGAMTRQFVYDPSIFSGSASVQVNFRYQLQAGDDGTLNVTGPISLNGGTIKAKDGTDAQLTFTPAADPRVIYDATPPPAPVISISPASPNSEQAFTLSGTAEPGSTVFFRAGSAGSAVADASGNWSLTFGPRAAGTYTYAAAARDRAGNVSAASNLSFTVQPETPPPGAPVVTGLTLPADRYYGEGTVRNDPHEMYITVNFNARVIVTGAPTLALKVGSALRMSGAPRSANTGLGFTSITFPYVPLYTDDGSLTVTGPIMLNGGTIKSESGADASLSFASVDAPGVIIDLVSPAYPTVTGLSPRSPTPDQSFTLSGTAEPFCTVGVSNEPQAPTAPVDANGNWSLTFPPRATGTYTLLIYTRDRANNTSYPPISSGGTPVTVTVQTTPTGGPPITTPPTNRLGTAGSSVTIIAGSVAPNATYQWNYNGAAIAGATNATLTVDNLAPGHTGLYSVVASDSGGSTLSPPAALGLLTDQKVLGAGQEVGSNIVHPNGNVYDQTLLTGSAVTLTADPGQVSRASWVDMNNEIVQVEFSGAGTLSIVLAVPSGPAPAQNYNQPGVAYMKGHAGLVITGANRSTNVSIFSVGRMTAVNQAIFRDDVNYEGVANLAFLAILSDDGGFGGIRAGNANFWSTRGVTGIFAPRVHFYGPVYLCEITATEDATPMLLLGSASDTRITGGDLLQTNGRAVQVSGLTQLRFTAGSTSDGQILPALACRGRLEDNSHDVTAQVAAQ